MSRENGGKRCCPGICLYLCLVLFLGGCAGTDAVPEDHFYRLATLSVEQPFESPPLAGVLRVERVEAVGLLRDRALLYSHAAAPQQLQRHHYHHWVGPPPVLVQDQLVQYLRDRRLADLVATDSMDRNADLHLRLEVRDFSRRLHVNGAAVRVELGLIAQPAGREPPLLVRRYMREVMANNGSPAAAVTAFDVALAEIYGELVQDLLQVTGE
ncbi:MAG: ABC-type transport auxiliary lipoprotein family protein [Gammaproteobacteria bacterium]|nr:ABC-type transport auxiliary lipoprotein family protein [Gammaproteobacteria bacterium]